MCEKTRRIEDKILEMQRYLQDIFREFNNRKYFDKNKN